VNGTARRHHVAEMETPTTTADVKRVWWLLLVLGVVSVTIGGMLIAWPGKTLTAATMLFGTLMVVSGVVRFVQALMDESSEHRGLLVLSAIIGVVLGVVVLRNPGAVIWLIVLLTGVFWIIGGMVDLFRGIAHHDVPDRGVRVVFGGLSAALGVAILVWPAPTVLVFAFFAGTYSILFGVLEIVAAFQVKNA
jgi:uncharacterized membrane protein HdeD (DUF308 family)